MLKSQQMKVEVFTEQVDKVNTDHAVTVAVPRLKKSIDT